MGLDITAYSRLAKVDAVFDAGGEPIDPQTREPIAEDYYRPRENAHHDRADGIEPRCVYRYGKAIGHHAGSYGGYNRWREQLAELAGWPKTSYEQYGTQWPSWAASAWNAESGPFWELINFSDCEGTIGPKHCAKLAKDFAGHQAKADAHDDERFRKLYAEWRAAFELAADSGAVSFH